MQVAWVSLDTPVWGKRPDIPGTKRAIHTVWEQERPWMRDGQTSRSVSMPFKSKVKLVRREVNGFDAIVDASTKHVSIIHCHSSLRVAKIEAFGCNFLSYIPNFHCVIIWGRAYHAIVVINSIDNCIMTTVLPDPLEAMKIPLEKLASLIFTHSSTTQKPCFITHVLHRKNCVFVVL